MAVALLTTLKIIRFRLFLFGPYFRQVWSEMDYAYRRSAHYRVHVHCGLYTQSHWRLHRKPRSDGYRTGTGYARGSGLYQ